MLRSWRSAHAHPQPQCCKLQIAHNYIPFWSLTVGDGVDVLTISCWSSKSCRELTKHSRTKSTFNLCTSTFSDSSYTSMMFGMAGVADLPNATAKFAVNHRRSLHTIERAKAQHVRHASRPHDPTATKVVNNFGNNSISKMTKVQVDAHGMHKIGMSPQALAGGPTHIFIA